MQPRVRSSLSRRSAISWASVFWSSGVRRAMAPAEAWQRIKVLLTQGAIRVKDRCRSVEGRGGVDP